MYRNLITKMSLNITCPKHELGIVITVMNMLGLAHILIKEKMDKEDSEAEREKVSEGNF